MPTYNWGFCKGNPFDYKNTPSKVAALSKHALKKYDFFRTKHPIYSFALWGKDAERLAKNDNVSSFGSDSLFSYFYDNSAKNLCLGVSFECSGTYVHHLEEKNNVPYRFLKNFTGRYIDNECGYLGLLDMRKAYDLIEEDILHNNSKSIVRWSGNQNM